MTRDVKIKSAGSALNIAENAKISESALKMTEYLWELNPGMFVNYILNSSRGTIFLEYHGTDVAFTNHEKLRKKTHRLRKTSGAATFQTLTSI